MIELRDIGKRFGNVQALQGVSVRFETGAIHALLGENGAGKSTLVNILAGLIRPDSGSIRMEGEPLPLGDSVGIRRRGVHMVHQHFMLVPSFTVAENFALTRARGGFASPKTHLPERNLGWEIDARRRIDQLSVGEQQRIELLRALDGETRYLILDEPTAVLAPAEIESLFGVLRQLASSGVGIVLIAHKLSEVLAIADEITVLRRGQIVAQVPRGAADSDQLAMWMVGEKPIQADRASQAFGEAVLACRNIQILSDRGSLAVDCESLQVRAGEILGIGGVDGNGQVELSEAVAGIRSVATGTIERPEKIGFIPADRRRQGLALGMSVAENLHFARESTWLYNPRTAYVRALSLIEQYEIKAQSPNTLVDTLSGGNQQKVIVARELSADPELVIAVHPTRGLDIRAAGFVHDQLRAAADHGAAILLISTDRDELAALADRTLYMQSGRLSDRFLEAG